MEYSGKNSSELRNLACKITDLLSNSFVNKKGLFIQGKVDQQVIDQLIIDDFGDVAPFIAIYGGEEICLRHIEYIETHINNLNFKRAFAYTDLILGLIWYSRIGLHKERALDLAKKLAAQAQERWIKHGKLFSASFQNVTLPITNGIDSTFLEVWSELYRETKEEKYRKLAEETFFYFRTLTFVGGNLVPKHAIYNSFITKILKKILPQKFNQIQVMKDNTNFLFSLLDLYRLGIYKDEVKKCFEDVYSSLAYHAERNTLNTILDSAKESDLLCSFAFIDLSCDAFKLMGDVVYLKTAEKLADYWIESNDGETGLFPFNYNGSESYLDSETDMAVALIKLSECSSNKAYYTKAIRLFEGLVEYHLKPEGLILKVNIYTGEPTNKALKTKFIALFIKLIHIIQSGQSIYENEELFMLAKDR